MLYKTDFTVTYQEKKYVIYKLEMTLAYEEVVHILVSYGGNSSWFEMFSVFPSVGFYSQPISLDNPDFREGVINGGTYKVEDGDIVYIYPRLLDGSYEITDIFATTYIWDSETDEYTKKRIDKVITEKEPIMSGETIVGYKITLSTDGFVDKYAVLNAKVMVKSMYGVRNTSNLLSMEAVVPELLFTNAMNSSEDGFDILFIHDNQIRMDNSVENFAFSYVDTKGNSKPVSINELTVEWKSEYSESVLTGVEALKKLIISDAGSGFMPEEDTEYPIANIRFLDTGKYTFTYTDEKDNKVKVYVLVSAPAFGVYTEIDSEGNGVFASLIDQWSDTYKYTADSVLYVCNDDLFGRSFAETPFSSDERVNGRWTIAESLPEGLDITRVNEKLYEIRFSKKCTPECFTLYVNVKGALDDYRTSVVDEDKIVYGTWVVLKAGEWAEVTPEPIPEETPKTPSISVDVHYSVSVSSENLLHGTVLYLYKINKETGSFVMTGNKKYKATGTGSVSISFPEKGDYVLVNTEEHKALRDQILATVAPAESKKITSAGKSVKFKLSNGLDMGNVKSVVYSIKKGSSAKISKKGTITGLKSGEKVTAYAKVTLKDGSKKTVKMTVTVK